MGFPGISVTLSTIQLKMATNESRPVRAAANKARIFFQNDFVLPDSND